ncbi:MAG: 4Fe-4S binding protein [Methanomassiliicoccaceae archaeon]|nr:4Fe-4S binding protein [Methanomassiliicoccaceae archaeon]
MVKAILIDEFKCDGCGVCVEACHEGALAIINGKAKMVREDFCDGLGDCLPVCPRGAISFIEACSCQGQDAPVIIMPGVSQPNSTPKALGLIDMNEAGCGELRQWPIKIGLVSAVSPIFKGADMLLASDCSAFAYSKIHEDFIKGRAVVTFCPKFDGGHREKLIEILSKNDPKSLTVVRMTVNCCSLDSVARDALNRSGKNIPLRVLVIDQRGSIREGGQRLQRCDNI